MAKASSELLILIIGILIIYGAFFTFLYFALEGLYDNLSIINDSLLYGCILSFVK